MERRRPPRRVLCAALVVIGALVAWDVTPVLAQSDGSAVLAVESPGLESEEPAPRELDVAGDGVLVDAPPTASQAGDPARLVPASDRERGSSFDQDSSVRVEELTSPTLEVFDNGDSSYTARVTSLPVRFEETPGVWRDIDLDFVSDGGGDWRAEASPVGVTVLGDPSRGLVHWDSPAGPVVMSVPDVAGEVSAPRPEDGRVVLEPADESGPSVRVDLTVSGFEQDLVVPRADGPSSYRVRFSVPDGVSVRESAAGVELVGRDGELLGGFGGGIAFDSTAGGVDGRGFETGVSTRLVGFEGAVAVVEVAVDPGWFGDPERVFPVVIDPSFYTTTEGDLPGFGRDTFVQYNLGTPQGSNVELRSGPFWYPFNTVTRSLLWFDLSTVANQAHWVDSAQLSMYNTASVTQDGSSCVPRPTEVYGAGAPFDPATTLWPGPFTDGWGVRATDSFPSGSPPSCGAGWVQFGNPGDTDDTGVTQVVRDWVWYRAANPFAGVAQQGLPNLGFVVASGDEDDPNFYNSYRTFRSGNYSAQEAPALELTYRRLANESVPTEPAPDARLATLQPTVKVAAAGDPDGDPVQYYYRLATGPDGNSGAIVANSGWLPSTTSWTVPANTLVDGQTYYWQVWTYDGNSAYRRPAWVRRFTVDLRLGAGGPSPTDAYGPVSVNLATGNVAVQTASPSFATVGGSMGLTYTHNSLAPQDAGLAGSYFPGYNTNGPTGQVGLQRRDGPIYFDWRSGPPGVGVGPDGFAARWQGYLTVPASGDWQFGYASDDGMRVWVDNQSVINEWTDQSMPSAPHWRGTRTLSGNVAVPIKIEFYDNKGTAAVELHARCASGACTQYASGQAVPLSWLSVNDSPLPEGWSVTADLDGSAAFSSAQASNSAVVLKRPDGSSETWNWTGSGWAPPPEGDGTLTNAPDGKLVLADVDGLIYTFRADGGLESVVSALDDTRPAAPRYTWQSNPNRLTEIEDPVSGRTISLTYKQPGQSNCPSAPSGFDAQPPEWMLCRVDYSDFGAGDTKLFYDNMWLARLEDPGGEVTDFAYDATGRIVRIRDPLAADKYPTTGCTDTSNDTCTVVAYNSDGKASQVTLPRALPADPNRPSHSYTYGFYLAAYTNVAVAGLPGVVARQVTHDTSARLGYDTDATGRTTITVYDGASDRVARVTDPAGLRTTTIYDTRHRPIEQYGPAPAAWFDDVTNLPKPAYVAQVPKSTTTYDQNVLGLGATYYPNPDLVAAPELDPSQAHTTGVNATGTVDQAWGTAAPIAGIPADNWSARYTGDITFTQEGTWALKADASDDQSVRLSVDDRQVIDAWAPLADPDSASLSANDVHVFVRDSNNQLGHRWYANSTWASEELGGALASGPGATAKTADQTLHVFGRGTDNQLYQIYYDASGWHGWYPLGGLLDSAPDAAVIGNTIHVFVRGQDNQLWHKWATGATWTGWEALGGTLTSDPSAVADGSILHVFARGANNQLAQRFWNGSVWSAWIDTPDTEPLESAPDAATPSAGNVHVFARTTNSALLQLRAVSGSWLAPLVTEATTMASGPGVSARGPNKLDVFTQDTTNQIVTRHFNGIGWTPPLNSGWIPVGAGTYRLGGFYVSAAQVGKPLRVRLETADLTGDANLTLSWDPPGSSPMTVVPASALNARYGLTTTTTDADGKVTRTSYQDFALAMPTAVTQDPAGLNLTTSTTYETPGTNHYLRRTSRTLPAGNTWAYSYHGADGHPASVDDPCTTGTQNIDQAGALRTRTGPDPDAGGGESARVEELRYDQAGRLLASQVNGTGWGCTTYDTRGRTATRSVPAFAGEPARTVTWNYAVGGDPLVTSVGDASGTITSTVDLLGRVVSYTDALGKVTASTYDQAGRLTDTNGPTGAPATAVHTDYDAAGRAELVKLGGLPVADPAYDTGGRLTTVAYPSGSGNTGNGTSLAPVGYDNLGRVTNLTWKDAAAATMTADQVTRSLAGDVTDQSIDGTDPYPSGANFVYDGAGRLSTARVPGHTYTYNYAPSGGCGPLTAAGKNTNRTSLVDNSVTVATYCYDHADRLTSTTTPGMDTISYDPHGNTTALGAQTMGYDGADRHLVTKADGQTVRYTRDALDRITARVVTGVAWRAEAHGSNGSGATSLTLARPAGTQTNDLLLAQVTVSGGTGVTITAPSGWTAVETATNGTGVRTAIYRHLAAGGDPANWAWNLSTSTPAAGGISGYHGVDTTDPIDASTTATSSATTSHTAASVTTSAAGARLVALYGTTTATNLTPTTSAMTERYDQPSAGSSPVTAETSDQGLTASGATGTRIATTPAGVNSANVTVALSPAFVSEVQYYAYSADGDTPDATYGWLGVALERNLGLPGGVTLTKKTAGDIWSYPNIHGDITTTANSAGTKTGGTYTYDPYGTPLAGLPDNTNGTIDNAWLGQHQRPLDHRPGLHPTIEMGARQYLPTLGRFLEVDPVTGGTTTNDYGYVPDPVNQFDLSGEFSFGSLVRGVTETVRRTVRGGVSRARRAIRTVRALRRTGYALAGRTVRAARGAARHVVRRASVGVSGCIVLCGGFSFSGGDAYASIGGVGLSTPGITVGYATVPASRQSSSGPFAFFQFGPVGAGANTGATKEGGEWFGGHAIVSSPGIGAGAGGQYSHCLTC